MKALHSGNKLLIQMNISLPCKDIFQRNLLAFLFLKNLLMKARGIEDQGLTLLHIVVNSRMQKSWIRSRVLVPGFFKGTMPLSKDSVRGFLSTYWQFSLSLCISFP